LGGFSNEYITEFLIWLLYYVYWIDLVHWASRHKRSGSTLIRWLPSMRVLAMFHWGAEHSSYNRCSNAYYLMTMLSTTHRTLRTVVQATPTLIQTTSSPTTVHWLTDWLLSLRGPSWYGNSTTGAGTNAWAGTTAGAEVDATTRLCGPVLAVTRQ